MPDRVVQGPDGITHRFPADATDDEISAVLNAGPRSPDVPATKKRTWTDTAVDALPAVGGAVGGLLGATTGPLTAVAGAGAGGMVGTRAKQYVKALRGDEALPPAGQAIADMGKEALMQGGAEATGGLIGKGMAKAGSWLMQSAVKPTLSVLDEYRTTAPKLVKTLLDEGINVTDGGLAKLQQLFGETNRQIRQAVEEAPGLIEKPTVAARALETAGRFAKQTNPTKDLQTVGDTVEEFLNHPVYPGALTVPEAQALKTGTYREIGKKYGEVSSAGIETQKALARGLKEEVAAKVPGIAKLNQRDSDLMAAMDATGRRVALSGNKDPVGFAWVTANPTTFIAALIDRNPAVKSMIARGLYNSAGSAAKVSPQLIRAAVTAIASGEADGTSDSPASQ